MTGLEIPGYRIERELGRGGMARVYLALQYSLQRRVALKVLDPQLAQADPGFVERFIREGQIAARLRHPNIQAVHDVGIHQGQAYLALEYLDGGSAAGMRLDAAAALALLRQIASALACVHAHGLVHRDVKPANLLRHPAGHWVLADFGIARRIDGSTAGVALAGTPTYMAPELWQSLPVDGRADLYSLGIVLYELLTGAPPFVGDDAWAVGMQHLHAPLPRLPPESAGLQGLLAGLLAKSADLRFASAPALLEALERPALAVPPPGPVAEPRALLAAARPAALGTLFEAPRPTRWLRWLAFAALLSVAAGLSLWLHSDDALERILAGQQTLATVAVLPCEVYGERADTRLAGDVLAEELIHRLSRLRALTVIARSSSFPLRGHSASRVGEELRASHLLACTLRPTADGVRVMAELVDTATGVQRWSAEFDRDPDQLLAVVDELAVGISERLLVTLAGAERARLLRHRSDSPDAIQAVEQARRLAQAQSPEGLSQARALLRRAQALDPEYALATLAMAEVYRSEMQLTQKPLSWWQASVRPLVDQALAVDAEHAYALVLRSELRCAEHDWAGCRADIDQALRLEPGLGDAQLAAANYQMTLGDRERGVDHASRLVRIEPDAPRAWTALTLALLHAGRPEQALAASERLLRLDPDDWQGLRAQALTLQTLHRCADAIGRWQHAGALAPAVDELQAGMIGAAACADRPEQARALLLALQRRQASGDPISDRAWATAYLATGDRARALDALEQMARANDPRLWEWLANPSPDLAALTRDPRLQALRQALDLPAASATAP